MRPGQFGDSLASQKVVLSAPVEVGMKNVLRTSISATSKDLGRKPRRNAMKMDIRVDGVAFKHPNHCLLLLSMSIYVFHASFTEG
jgi:hypothetical protein